MFVSVILPAYNSEKTIAKTLSALKNQNFHGKYEIIVVDDGSKDNTAEIAKKFKVKVFTNPHRGPAYQRNFGAKKAKGDIIIFTDSDCIPDKNWLKEITQPFRDKDIVGVSGTYRTLNKNKIIARFEGYEIEKRHERMARQKYIDFIGTFSAAYRKNIFLKFGGFDTSFPIASGEDPELSFRIAKAGYKMVFNPKAFVYHPHVDSLSGYLKQKFYRAYWRVLMYKKHPDKLAKDSYTGMEIPLSAVSLSLFFVSILLIPFFKNFYLPLLFLSFLFIANSDSIIFMAKKEKKMFFFASAMIFLRTLVWIIGFDVGFIKLRLLK